MSRRAFETRDYAAPAPLRAADPLPGCLTDPAGVLDEAALIAACRKLDRIAARLSLGIAALALGGFALPAIVRAFAALL